VEGEPETIVLWARCKSPDNDAEKSRDGGVADTIDLGKQGVQLIAAREVNLQWLSSSHAEVIHGSHSTCFQVRVPFSIRELEEPVGFGSDVSVCKYGLLDWF